MDSNSSQSCTKNVQRIGSYAIVFADDRWMSLLMIYRRIHWYFIGDRKWNRMYQSDNWICVKMPMKPRRITKG